MTVASGTESGFLSSAEIVISPPAPKRIDIKGSTLERLLSLTSPLILLILWEILVRVRILDVRFFSQPSTILSTLWTLLITGELLTHFWTSIVRILIGFLMGGVPALFLGLVMGLSPLVRAAINPLVAATYPIPKIAILPLIMLIFGLGETSKYVIVAIATFYLVLVNTTAGVVNIESIYLDVGKNFKASRLNMYLTIALPGALPLIFTGFRLAWGVAFLVIVAAEMMGAKSGLGYLVWNSWQVFQVDAMFVGLITISVLGFVSSLILDEIERVLIPWRKLHLEG